MHLQEICPNCYKMVRLQFSTPVPSRFLFPQTGMAMSSRSDSQAKLAISENSLDRGWRNKLAASASLILSSNQWQSSQESRSKLRGQTRCKPILALERDYGMIERKSSMAREPASERHPSLPWSGGGRGGRQGPPRCLLPYRDRFRSPIQRRKRVRRSTQSPNSGDVSPELRTPSKPRTSSWCGYYYESMAMPDRARAACGAGDVACRGDAAGSGKGKQWGRELRARHEQREGIDDDGGKEETAAESETYPPGGQFLGLSRRGPSSTRPRPGVQEYTHVLMGPWEVLPAHCSGTSPVLFAQARVQSCWTAAGCRRQG